MIFYINNKVIYLNITFCVLKRDNVQKLQQNHYIFFIFENQYKKINY